MVWNICNVEVSTSNPYHDAMLEEMAVALGLLADTDRYTVSEELSRRYGAYYDAAYDQLEREVVLV